MNKIFRIIDTVVFYIFSSVVLFISFFVIFIRMPKRISVKNKNPKKMLYFMWASGGIEAIEKLKQLSLLKTDLNGYFKKVYTVFFVHRPSPYIEKKYNETHTVLQFSHHPDGRLRKTGFKRLNSFLGEMHLFFRLLKVINEEKINIIRAQGPHLQGLNALLLSRATGIPYTIHIVSNYDLKRLVHNLEFPPFKFRFVECFIESVIIKNAYFVTSSYRSYKDFAICHGADPKRTFSLRTGVDEVHFQEPQNRKDLRHSLALDGKKILFYAGRLHPAKFPQDLVKCMSEVSKRFEDAMLVIAGEGRMRSELERLTKELDIEDKVIFIGSQAQESLKNLYITADIIVFTHAGMTLVEAGLSETPIVAYDYDWHSEFIGYNERGLLADFRDYRGLAEKVCQILSNPEKGRELGRRAREFAIKNFNWPLIVDIERKVLEKFLGN